MLLSGLKTRGEAESFSNRQYTIATFLNCFKISDIHCRSTHSCINVQILGYFGLQHWTQSLAVYLSDIKTLIKHYFLLFNEFLKKSYKFVPDFESVDEVTILSKVLYKTKGALSHKTRINGDLTTERKLYSHKHVQMEQQCFLPEHSQL